MESFFQFVYRATGISPSFQLKLIYSAGVLVGLTLIRLLLLKLIESKVENARRRYVLKKIASYTISVAGMLALLRIWLKSFGQLGTFLGLLSAGIAIALKDPLANIAGWLFILIRQPFSIGDRIEIGNNRGDVIDIRLFQFSLMEVGNWVEGDQPTGRIIHIPNGKIFTEPLANYTQEFEYIWDEIPVLITFESDWKKAKEILLKAAESILPAELPGSEPVSSKFMMKSLSFRPQIYTSIRESGILLTLRYPCHPDRRRELRHRIWEFILEAFEREVSVNFAYPTSRVLLEEEN